MLPCEGAKAQRRKVPRRRKAPARPADPSRAEVAAAPLVDALTDPDEPRRQAAARHVLRTCVPAVVALLCRCLVERLLAGPLEGRRAARASLCRSAPPPRRPAPARPAPPGALPEARPAAARPGPGKAARGSRADRSAGHGPCWPAGAARRGHTARPPAGVLTPRPGTGRPAAPAPAPSSAAAAPAAAGPCPPPPSST